jgi:hypothetical protein
LQKYAILKKRLLISKIGKQIKARYQLSEIGNGVVALSIKESMRGGEAFHRICADCAASGQKKYLQPQITGPHYEQYKCQGCGSELRIDKGSPPRSADQHRYNPLRRW